MLLSLGGDISTSGPAPAPGWHLHVTDDHRDGPEAPGQTIAIRSGGLATSSLVTRRWTTRRPDDTPHSRSARRGPAQSPWRTVSVAAATCADANIASTAAIVLAADAPHWLIDHDLPARLVARDGTAVLMGIGPHDRRSQRYWYLTRASGAVALVLLTASLVIGIAAVLRLRSAGVPRFVIDGIHRTASMLAVAFLLVHILTAVLDTFAPITLINAVIPFTGNYRPFWLGLGAVAFDLLLAVTMTSLLRRRLGHGAWRAVHWLAYASWPVAVLHGFGTGSDVHQSWMLAIDMACIIVVLVAIVIRIAIGWPEHLRVRIGALGVTAAFALGLVAWLPSGPLGNGWARRAGTPTGLLRPARGGRT